MWSLKFKNQWSNYAILPVIEGYAFREVCVHVYVCVYMCVNLTFHCKVISDMQKLPDSTKLDASQYLHCV
jgi:hypothetical protein